MCDSEDHQHITVPPRYEDIDEEQRGPLPPPLSPLCVHRSSSSQHTHPQAQEDHRVGGLLLSCMEDRPMEERKERDTSPPPGMKKLLSEKGLFTLYNIFENISFKGKGHEVEDLETLLEGFQGWACQLCPQHDFEDLATHLEEMGRLPQVQTCWGDMNRGLVSTRDQIGCAGSERKDGSLGDGAKAEENREDAFS